MASLLATLDYRLTLLLVFRLWLEFRRLVEFRLLVEFRRPVEQDLEGWVQEDQE